MARRITIYGNINVFPTVRQGPEGQVEAKELVITDVEGATDYVYPMSKELAENIGRDLKMSNKALFSKLQDETERQRARDLLAGGNGTAISPEDILKGVSRKDDA